VVTWNKRKNLGQQDRRHLVSVPQPRPENERGKATLSPAPKQRLCTGVCLRQFPHRRFLFPSFAAWGCPSRCRQIDELGKNTEKLAVFLTNSRLDK
jgi:hypothetical protein